MKKILVALVLAFIMPVSVFSQIIPQDAEDFRYQVKAINDIRNLDDLKKYYDGSVLLFEDWTPAVVTMDNGNEENMMMNYFLYDNSLIYLKGQDSVMTFGINDRVKRIEVGDRHFRPVTYTDRGATTVGQGVFEVIHDGSHMSLVKRHEMELKPGQDGSGYREATRPAIVAKSSLYYQPTKTALSYPVPMSKKEFYTIFGDRAKDVEAYAKQNRLKINEQGIAKMIEYYNGLQ